MTEIKAEPYNPRKYRVLTTEQIKLYHPNVVSRKRHTIVCNCDEHTPNQRKIQ